MSERTRGGLAPPSIGATDIIKRGTDRQTDDPCSTITDVHSQIDADADYKVVGTGG